MQRLPAIPLGAPVGGSGGLSATGSRGTFTQQLIGGGTTTQRLPKTHSGYQIGWKIRGAADIDLLNSFYTGVQGSGPFCLVDPTQSNFLPPNVSGMGLIAGTIPEWQTGVSSGAIAVSTATPPTGVLSGVMGWTGAANASTLYMGINNVLDGTWLPPVIPGLSHAFGISAKLLSGTGSLTAAILGGPAGGAQTAATVTATTTALNTSTWVDVSALVAAAFSWPTTSDFIQLRLTVSSATSPSILLSAPWMTYDTATAIKPSPWVNGIGVPRCVIVGDADSPVGRPGLRDYTMTLAEVA